jgi:hypothetical protein
MRTAATAIDGAIDEQPDALQQVHRHLTVECVVFGEQQASTREMSTQRILGVVGRCEQWQCAATAPQAGGEPEGAALAGRTVGTGIAAHQARQAAGDGQAEAAAAVLARGRGIGLLEAPNSAAACQGRCRCRYPRPRSAAAGPRPAVFEQTRAQAMRPCSVNLTALPA